MVSLSEFQAWLSGEDFVEQGKSHAVLNMLKYKLKSQRIDKAPEVFRLPPELRETFKIPINLDVTKTDVDIAFGRIHKLTSWVAWQLGASTEEDENNGTHHRYPP